MTLPRAAHLDLIQPFRVMELLDQAKQMEAQGHSVIHMEVGEPDFETPAPIIEAGIRALQQGQTHYTAARGAPELRQAISQYYLDKFNTAVDADRILITPGASGALQLALSVLIDPGNEVLLADPGYPCNRNFIRLLGAHPQAVNVDADSGFQVTPDHLPEYWTDNTRALLLASPSNPTGTLIPKQDMSAMLEYVRARDGAVIVDEIYQGLTYEGDSYTVAELSDDVFVINSFSKYFGMTGWRVGWIVAPQAYVADLDKLAQNLYLATSTPAQMAALQAFSSQSLEILDARRDTFKQRRDYLLPALSSLGFKIDSVPQGAFYIYADCTDLTDDSYQFCQDILSETAVAITPGLDFGDNRPQCFMRFAYTTDLDKMKEAVSRLQKFINDRNDK